MKRIINKKGMIIISVAILLFVAVGTVLAIVFTSTDPIENKFTPSNVSCAVVEANGNPVEGALVNTGSSKTDVQVKNTGNTDAYIRVAVTVNWSNAEGTAIWAEKPIRNVHYTVSFSDDGWFYGDDGFYYCKEAVSKDGLTKILIKEASLVPGVTPPVGTDGTVYYLSIEIIASAIQASPSDAVEKSWNVNVASDGTLVKQGGIQ